MSTLQNTSYQIQSSPHHTGYRFRDHGSPTFYTGLPYSNFPDNWNLRPSPERDNVVSPDTIVLRDLIEPKKLVDAFQILKKEKGQGAGIDKLSYHHYSPSECWEMARQLSDRINQRRYRPARTRLVRIPKPDGGQRELELQCIPDRLVAYLLQKVLMPFFNERLPALTQSVHALYAKLELYIENRNHYSIVTDDIENCFPSAPIAPTIECHRQIINNPDLLWLIETVIRGHAGQNQETGLCQGSPYSPAALELLLHNHLDSRFQTEYRGSRNLYRYVDNLLIVCNNEHDCRQAVQFAEASLTELGFRLKHNEGPPMDLRYNTERTILGFIPCWQDGKLNFTIPEDAYGKLEISLNKATLSRYPLKYAVAAAEGWISAYGPALVNQAVQDVVVERVNGICRSGGFLEIKPSSLLQTVSNAHQKWQELRRSVRTPTDNQ